MPDIVLTGLCTLILQVTNSYSISLNKKENLFSNKSAVRSALRLGNSAVHNVQGFRFHAYLYYALLGLSVNQLSSWLQSVHSSFKCHIQTGQLSTEKGFSPCVFLKLHWVAVKFKSENACRSSGTVPGPHRDKMLTI